MDAIRISRKRNRRSPSMPVTLTRSRSRLLLHRNRSGQLSPDPRSSQQEEPYSELVRFCGNGTTMQGPSEDDTVLLKDLRKKAKRDGGDLSLPLTKDLRARRVYSPQSSAGGAASSDLIDGAFPKESAVDSDCADLKTADLGFGSPASAENGGMCADDVTMSARIEEETESPDLGLSCEDRSFDGGNTESPEESMKLEDHMKIDGENGGDCSEKIDVLGEEPVLTTPPDAIAEMCGNSKDDGDVGKREEELRVKDASFAGNAMKNSGEGFSGKDGQKNGSVLKSKSVLRPRFHGKLFKAPGSVSYRRLFPFLMDIMGDVSGTPNLGHCQKDEKGMDGQEFKLPLSSQSHEASNRELKTDSCTVRDTTGTKLTSSPMRLDVEEASGPTSDFAGVKDVGNALHNDDFKQNSIHKNNAKATNHSGCGSEQFDASNEDCILTTPDAKTCDNSVVNVDQLQSMPQDACHVEPMDLTRSTHENAIEGVCPKADKRNDPLLKSKSVPRPHLHRKLFKTPGSVSYRRFLPFLMDLTKDDSGTSNFGHQTHHKKDEANMCAKGFQLPLTSQSEEAFIKEQKTVSGPMHDTVESNALENNILVNPANELSHGYRPKLTSSQDFHELAMQLDAKEVVHECLSAPSVKEHKEKVVIGSKDECLSESKFDPCSVMVNFHCAKIAANAVHNDGFNHVQNKISGQHCSESPLKDQNNENMLYSNDDVSNLTFEHHSRKEKGFTIDYDERKQFVNLEKHESVSRCPPEGQSPSQSDSNMQEAGDNKTSSRAISKSDDAVVLNHVNVSNEELRPSSEKIISDKPDMAAHSGDKAESVLKDIVYGSRMPSKGSNNKDARCGGEIENGSEYKTTLVLNRCPRIKLLKHAGSFSYKRMLPFFLNNMEYNSCASINHHYPKLQKPLDQTPLLPISDLNLRVTPISDSNDCIPMDHCTGNSGAQQETGLQVCDLNTDSSSPRSQISEVQSSHDSCKVILDEQVVLNGPCKLESSTDLPISVRKNLPITPLRTIIDEVISREEEVTTALSESSVYSVVTGNGSFPISSNEKPPEAHGCCQSLSQLKVTEQLRVPAVGFQQGILKRNPRGCRGLCTCLNCTSFRLHAERAFEFSRNQLLDSQEVAQDLMKELSHLRNMLEGCTDGVNSNPVFDGSQVKEACRKAFETEQLAKDRLSQMNDDLNIHCRISSLQRPRVRFADHVEEKFIQPDR